jgi:hypothetical protein
VAFEIPAQVTWTSFRKAQSGSSQGCRTNI